MTGEQHLFSGEEWLRYSRHLLQGRIGAAGQTRLRRAAVVVVGLGGLGSPVAQYLTAAGVGRLVLIDGDRVDLSNLQRQPLYTLEDVGESKAQAARRRLTALNPHIAVEAHSQWLDEDHARALAAADLVMDCTDRIDARYRINHLCLRGGTPWCYAAVADFSAQLALFRADRAPEAACYGCLFPEPAPSGGGDCNANGILGAVPGVAGALQALVALKFLLGLETGCDNRLLQWDLLTLGRRGFELAPAPDCRHCRGAAPPGELATCTSPGEVPLLPAREFRHWRYAIWDLRSEAERSGFHLGGQHRPFDESDFHRRLRALPRDEPLLLYCETGGRSGRAASLARELGWTGVRSLDGGVQAVLEAEREED